MSSHSKYKALLCFILFVTLIPIQAQVANETKLQVGTTQKIGDVILFALPVATIGTSFIIGDKDGA